MAGKLEPVIPRAERAEPKQDEQRLDDEGVVEFCPKQRSYGYGKQYYKTSHRGCVGLSLVEFVEAGMIEFGLIADFHFHQPADYSWAAQQSYYQTGERRADGAECNVLICVKAQFLGIEKSQQLVNQSFILSSRKRDG